MAENTISPVGESVDHLTEGGNSFIPEPVRTARNALTGLLMSAIVATGASAEESKISPFSGEEQVADASGEFQVAALVKQWGVLSVPGTSTEITPESWYSQLYLDTERSRTTVLYNTYTITEEGEFPNPYGEDALKRLASYSPEVQAAIADYVYELGEGAASVDITSDELLDFEPNEAQLETIYDLRISNEAYDDVVMEAETHDRMSPRRMEAFKKILADLRAFGQITERELSTLARYAPKTSKHIPAVQMMRALIESIEEWRIEWARLEAEWEILDKALQLLQERFGESS